MDVVVLFVLFDWPVCSMFQRVFRQFCAAHRVFAWLSCSPSSRHGGVCRKDRAIVSVSHHCFAMGSSSNMFVAELERLAGQDQSIAQLGAFFVMQAKCKFDGQPRVVKAPRLIEAGFLRTSSWRVIVWPHRQMLDSRQSCPDGAHLHFSNAFPLAPSFGSCTQVWRCLCRCTHWPTSARTL